MTCPNLSGDQEPSGVKPVYTPENPCCEMPKQFYITIEEAIVIAESLDSPINYSVSVDESVSASDDASVDITSGSPNIIFEDNFTGTADILDNHLADIPASTSWENVFTSPQRLVINGSGEMDHEGSPFDDGGGQAFLVIDGTSTPRDIAHSGSVEFTCDVTFPSGDFNAKLSHSFEWLKWHSTALGTDLIAVSRFVIDGTPGSGTIRLTVSFERNDGSNQDNVASASVLVTDSVPIRLGWKISVDMEDLEMWWAPVSDLGSKTTFATNAGTQGPYSAVDGTVKLFVNAATGDGVGTLLFNLPISRVAIEQF